MPGAAASQSSSSTAASSQPASAPCLPPACLFHSCAPPPSLWPPLVAAPGRRPRPRRPPGARWPLAPRAAAPAGAAVRPGRRQAGAASVWRSLGFPRRGMLHLLALRHSPFRLSPATPPHPTHLHLFRHSGVRLPIVIHLSPQLPHLGQGGRCRAARPAVRAGWRWVATADQLTHRHPAPAPFLNGGRLTGDPRSQYCQP